MVLFLPHCFLRQGCYLEEVPTTRAALPPPEEPLAGGEEEGGGWQWVAAKVW